MALDHYDPRPLWAAVERDLDDILVGVPFIGKEEPSPEPNPRVLSEHDHFPLVYGRSRFMCELCQSMVCEKCGASIRMKGGNWVLLEGKL